MAHDEDLLVPRHGKRHSRRHAKRRLQRWLRRYWPLWVLLGALAALLVVVAIRNQQAAALQAKFKQEDFALTVANMSGQPLRQVQVLLTWPDQSAELTCHLEDVQPSEVLVRKIYAPPGSRLHVAVTLANGVTTAGDRELAAGTQGGLRINVHEKGALGLGE
jgi:hypothetical protein